MPLALYVDLERLAKRSNLKIGAYARLVLAEAARKKVELQLNTPANVPAIMGGSPLDARAQSAYPVPTEAPRNLNDKP